MPADVADVELTIHPRKKFSLSHLWKTSIQKVVTGGEKRTALYTWPRVQADYETKLINDTEFNWIARKLYKYLYGLWGIPIWPDRTALSSQANSGQKVLNVDETDNFHFYVGRDIIIINPTNFQLYEIGKVESLTSTSITLDANLSNTWPIGSLVLPRYLFRIEDPQEVQAKVFQYQELKFSVIESFESLRSFTYTIPESGASVYKGLDVFQFIPYNGIECIYNKPWNLLQFLGLGYTSCEYEKTLIGIKGGYQEKGRDCLWNMLKFFDSKMGRWGDFWVPTWKKDIVVTAAILSTDTTISIQNIEYSTHWAVGDDIVGEYIQFYFPDGTKVFKQITSAPTSTSIIIDSATGKAVTSDELDLLIVSFLLPVRFNVDEIKFDYVDGNCEEVADIRLSFRGLKEVTLL